MIMDLKQQFSKDYLDNNQFEDLEESILESILKNKKFLKMYNLKFRTDFKPFIKEWKEKVKENVEDAPDLNLTYTIVLLAHYFINNPNNQEIKIYDEKEIKIYDVELYNKVTLFKDVLLKLRGNASTDNHERARELKNKQQKPFFVRYFIKPNIEERRTLLRMFASLTGLGIHALFSFTYLMPYQIALALLAVDLLSILSQWYSLHDGTAKWYSLHDEEFDSHKLYDYLTALNGVRDEKYAFAKIFLPNVMSMFYNVIVGSGVIPGIDESALYSLRRAAVALTYLVRIWNYEISN